jgi:hypothetical protein
VHAADHGSDRHHAPLNMRCKRVLRLLLLLKGLPELLLLLRL